MAILGPAATANLAFRFVVELGGVLALGYWGATMPSGTAVRVLLGLGAPLIMIVVWSLVAAPRAASGLTPTQRDLAGTALLLLAAAALAAAGRPQAALVFGAVIVVNVALLLLLGEGALTRTPGEPAGR